MFNIPKRALLLSALAAGMSLFFLPRRAVAQPHLIPVEHKQLSGVGMVGGYVAEFPPAVASTPYMTVQLSPRTANSPLGFSVGVNLAGLEFGTNFPGIAGTNYFVPTHGEVDYYYAKGIRTIRLPFEWERLQPALSGALDPTYLRYVRDIATYAASRGITVILDMHNGGAYQNHKLGDGMLTSEHFADFWRRLAEVFAPDGGTHFAYDIMNEPNNMPSRGAWPSAAQAAINAIRTVDANTYIYVEGDGWSSAYRWVTNNPTLQSLNDPSDRLVFSAHVYADRDSSGTHFKWSDEVAAGDRLDIGAPLTTDILVKRLTPFVVWLRTHGFRGQVGELGVSRDDRNWLITMDKAYAYLEANGIPVTQWAGGPAWGSYGQSVEPGTWLGDNKINAICDATQMAVMTKYSGADQPTAYFLIGPRTGSPGEPSNKFTIAYRGVLKTATTISPSDGGAGGTFAPSSITLPPGMFNPDATFTYTAPSATAYTISVSNNGGLTDPGKIGYLAIVDQRHD